MRLLRPSATSFHSSFSSPRHLLALGLWAFRLALTDQNQHTESVRVSAIHFAKSHHH